MTPINFGLSPLGRSVRRDAGGGGATPLHWFEFDDLSLLFTDSGKTTPVTTNGDVVGAATDKAGNTDALQPTTSSKPLWRDTGDGKYIYHDRVDDALTIAGVSSGTYTFGAALWGGSQIWTHVQGATETLSLNPADYYALVIYEGVLSAEDKTTLLTYLDTKSPAGTVTDLFRLWSSVTSVALDISQTGDAGASWESGDGQTASGTLFSKTLASAPEWVTLRANTPANITGNFFQNSENLFGNLMDLSGISANRIYFYSNQLTGSISSSNFSANVERLRLQANQLTGSIPDLSSLTSLQQFYVYSNTFTGYDGGGIPSTVGLFLARDNNLTQEAIDLILSDLVDGGRTSGDGTVLAWLEDNTVPSAAGLADKAILQGRGWTVTTD